MLLLKIPSVGAKSANASRISRSIGIVAAMYTSSKLNMMSGSGFLFFTGHQFYDLKVVSLPSPHTFKVGYIPDSQLHESWCSICLSIDAVLKHFLLRLELLVDILLATTRYLRLYLGCIFLLILLDTTGLLQQSSS